MLFSWLKNRRRRRLLAMPFPDDWPALFERIAHYRLLGAGEQERLRGLARIFIAEKGFEGCNGLEITDGVRVTIATLASILLLGLDDFYFDNVQTILVYPGAFVAPAQVPIGGD